MKCLKLESAEIALNKVVIDPCSNMKEFANTAPACYMAGYFAVAASSFPTC